MAAPTQPAPKRPVRYFVSYARDDAKLPDKLLTELRKKLGACRDYEFIPWRDTDILVGTEWNASIQAAVKECDFGLLLVSPAFLGKKYITEKELPHFVVGDKPCVPVTLSRIDFEEMDLKGLEPMQFFGLVGKNDVHPRSFEECSSGPQKSAFALQLYQKIKARLDDVFVERSDADTRGKGVRRDAFDESAYRAHIRKHYKNLQIEAIGGDAIYRDIELQQVFIPQDARDCRDLRPEALEGPADLTLKALEVPVDLKRRAFENRTDTTPKVADLSLAELHEHKRFRDTAPREILGLLDDPSARHRVVLGAPGAGKSSLTRVRLLAWAREPAGHPLPILVELRRFHVSGSKDFLEYLENNEHLIFHFRVEDLRTQLANGTAELIFDGLDEIFEPAARESAARQIARYATQFSKARYLVTSRLIGYPGRILRDAGFAHWLLADFDENKIAAFLHQWLSDAICEPGDRAIVRRRMDDALRSPVIRELAGNPLLLTLMAVLARKSDLPRDLASLYARAADLLLEQWDTHRMLAADVQLGNVIIDQKDKRDLLRDLAWKMQTGQRGLRGNLISEKEVRDAMEAAFQHRIPDPGLRRKAIGLLIDQLTERNYILCHVGGAQFAFVHRGFLEFFASEYLVHRIAATPDTALAEIGETYKAHAKDDAWREVLILAASRFDPAVADKILLPLVEGANEARVSDAIFKRTPDPFTLVCEVLGRAREPQKLATVHGYVRTALEGWIRGQPDNMIAAVLVRLLADNFSGESTHEFLEFLGWASAMRTLPPSAPS